ncbi:MAG: OmpA family protein [Pseudomonadota bacterium]
MLSKKYFFIVKKLSCVICLLGLMACQSSIKELREYQPVNSEFHQLLSGYYLEFSEKENKANDWIDSEYFAAKGLLVAKGAKIEPEHINNWDINNNLVPTVTQARQFLMDVQTDELRLKYPKMTAKTMFFFDCWLEQLEENWQERDIESCRENFYDILDRLYNNIVLDEQELLSKIQLDNNQQQKPPQTKQYAVTPSEKLQKTENIAIEKLEDATDQPQQEVKNIITQDITSKIFYYEIFYELDKYRPDLEGLLILKQIIKQIQKNKQYDISIILNGHADRKGTDQHNMILSEQRIKNLRDRLLEYNKELKIELFAFGETDNKVVTVDEVPNRLNRRVEIELKIEKISAE